MGRECKVVEGALSAIQFCPGRGVYSVEFLVGDADEWAQVQVLPETFTLDGRPVTFRDLLALLSDRRYDIKLLIPTHSYRMCREAHLTTRPEAT